MLDFLRGTVEAAETYYWTPVSNKSRDNADLGNGAYSCRTKKLVVAKV